MAVKRNGLGKGLDSLIPDKSEKTVKKPLKQDNIIQPEKKRKSK